MNDLSEVQAKILELSKTNDLRLMSLREIGRMIGVEHPQVVKYHLMRLVKVDLISWKPLEDVNHKLSDFIRKTHSIKVNLVSVPIVGSANAGPATIFAEEANEGCLSLSERLLERTKNIFAVRVVGNSMNMSSTKGGSLDNGDYAIVDYQDQIPKKGDYVLSIINGMANIKKFNLDDNENVVLLSESEQQNNYPPIYIHKEAFGENGYMINGKVIQVIKKPNL